MRKKPKQVRPFISIIIPAFNEEKLLQKSLGSIKKACDVFQKKKLLWEIIVCDNNSSDNTAKIAKEAGARVIFEPVNQIARARNRGASIARGKNLLFVDADSYPGKKLFAELLSCLLCKKIVGGGCLVRLDKDVGILFIGVAIWNFISRSFRFAAGSFIFCRAWAFKRVGGFGLEFYASEEIDFSKKMKKLARRRAKKFIILQRNPLKTSARKLELYSGEDFLTLLKQSLSPQETVLKKPSFFWYDGKR
ncbi:glycosyltransferase [Candidatus Riflebacteria bacterium]